MTNPNHTEPHTHETAATPRHGYAPFTVNNEPAELNALSATAPQERVDAMWADELTGSQLSAWCAHRPREVPLLRNEWTWIMKITPEYTEASDKIEASTAEIIQLPRRGEHRAAA